MTKTSAHKDFNRNSIAALRRAGIAITGSTWLPGADGSFANGERGYELNDNGTHKIRTYMQMRELIRSLTA
jgi:hypothetical protein